MLRVTEKVGAEKVVLIEQFLVHFRRFQSSFLVLSLIVSVFWLNWRILSTGKGSYVIFFGHLNQILKF